MMANAARFVLWAALTGMSDAWSIKPNAPALDGPSDDTPNLTIDVRRKLEANTHIELPHVEVDCTFSCDESCLASCDEGGLCFGGCDDACTTGCDGGCVAGCDEGGLCFGGCDGTCVGGCDSSCAFGCDSDCDFTGAACFSSCDDGCVGGCDDSCTTSCDDGCAAGTSCDEGCVTGCDGGCTLGCDDGCAAGTSCDEGCVSGCDLDCGEPGDSVVSLSPAPPSASPPIDSIHENYMTWVAGTLSALDNDEGWGRLQDKLNEADTLGKINQILSKQVTDLLADVFPLSIAGRTTVNVEEDLTGLNCDGDVSYDGTVDLTFESAGLSLTEIVELKMNSALELTAGAGFSLDFVSVTGKLNLGSLSICGLNFGGFDLGFSASIKASGALEAVGSFAWDKNGCGTVHLEQVYEVDPDANPLAVEITEMSLSDVPAEALINTVLDVADMSSVANDIINNMMPSLMPKVFKIIPGSVNPLIDEAVADAGIEACLEQLEQQCTTWCSRPWNDRRQLLSRGLDEDTDEDEEDQKRPKILRKALLAAWFARRYKKLDTVCICDGTTD